MPREMEASPEIPLFWCLWRPSFSGIPEKISGASGQIPPPSMCELLIKIFFKTTNGCNITLYFYFVVSNNTFSLIYLSSFIILIDFGLSKTINAINGIIGDTILCMEAVEGTPLYMSPILR